jgi:hypothetical protein
MLQAFLVLPAFALAYLIAAPTPLRRRILQLRAVPRSGPRRRTPTRGRRSGYARRSRCRRQRYQSVRAVVDEGPHRVAGREPGAVFCVCGASGNRPCGPLGLPVCDSHQFSTRPPAGGRLPSAPATTGRRW